MLMQRKDLCRTVRSINEFASDNTGLSLRYVKFFHIAQNTVGEIQSITISQPKTYVIWWPTLNRYSLCYFDRVEKI